MSKPSRRPSRQKQEFLHPGPQPDYRHKQNARSLLTLISFPLLICVLAALSNPEYRLGLIVAAAFLGGAAILFSSLTIEVTADTLSWRFGPGLIHKELALSEIASAEMVRSTWLDGWGIHYTRRGWLYNVSGLDALLIKRKDGKALLLGSDDPVGLWETLQNRIGN